MKHISIRDVLTKMPIGESVTLCGWVRTRRDSKSFSFIELNDGTCFSSIQVIADAGIANYENTVLKANTGSSVEIQGQVKESPGKGQKLEIHATEVKVCGTAEGEYPLQKKRHSREFLRTIAHLRARTNTFGSVFRVRHAASFAVHNFFNEQGFFHLHTPIITASDCEGAGQMFNVTALDLDNLPRENGKVDFTKDFFAEKTSLTVSGQLEAELYACALSKVYTFGPTFRAENSNTPRHLAEFWMIEPEMAFCDLAGDMELAEKFIRYVIKYVLDHCQEDMDFFDKWVEKGIIKSLQDICEAKFERVTYTDAVKILEKAKTSFEYPVKWGMDIQTEHEKYLTDEHFKKPVFVTDYPQDIKAFYMRLNDDNKTVAATDLLVPRLGEIIGGSQREERLDVLQQNMKKFGLEPESYDWYLDTRRYGTVPHAGFGLGFERLVMYLTGIENIRDVIPFPRTPGNAKF